MKEICIINYKTNAAMYGIGTYIEEYVYCLNKLDCKINRVELGTGETKSDFYVKEDGNIRTIYFPYNQKWNIDNYNKGVCRLIRLYLEDSDNLIFHFQYPESDSLLDGIKKYFPLSKSIFTIHYFNWSEVLKGNVALFEKIIRNRENEDTRKEYGYTIDSFEKEKTFFKKMDRIVCLSDDTMKMTQNLYEIKQNVRLVPNGLRKNFRKLSENQKLKLRKKYYIDPVERVLLYVGRIEYTKGIEQVIECFNDVVKEYSNCRLVVIGNGNIIGAIGKCKKAYSKITYTGRLDEKSLCQWYQISDIGLFPSFHEQCSFVGIEMMMHGLPIIASDGYGVKNMFQEGVNTKVAKIENWEKKSKFRENLKKSILYVLNSDLLKSELQKASKKEYKSKYSIERMQKGYLELLNSL